MSDIASDANSNSNPINQDPVNEQENVGKITRQDGSNNLNTQGTGDSTEEPGFFSIFSNIFGKKSSNTPSSETPSSDATTTDKKWYEIWKGGRKSKKNNKKKKGGSKKNKSNKKRRSGKKSNKKR